jgi:hypothetical protein
MQALDSTGELLRGKRIIVEELIGSGRDMRGEFMMEKYVLTEAQWNRQANENS